MTSKEKIVDIRYLIMECYSDKEPLKDYQKASRNCFFRYCDEIKQELERLEKLEEQIKELKSIIEEQSLKIANDSKEMSDMNLQIRQLKGEFMPLDCPK